MTDKSPDAADPSADDSFPWWWLLVAVFVAWWVINATLDALAQHGSVTVQTCTVTEKEPFKKYGPAVVRTLECGTLQVSEEWERGEPGAAAIYAALEPGHTYEVMTVGWNIPLLSRIPAVVGAPAETTTR